MYLNKNIITKKSYKERGEKLLGHKNEMINICSTWTIRRTQITTFFRTAWSVPLTSRGRVTNVRIIDLYFPQFAWSLKCTYMPRLALTSARRRYKPYCNDVGYESTIKKFMSIVFIQWFWQCWRTWWRRTKAKVSGKNLETLLTMGKYDSNIYWTLLHYVLIHNTTSFLKSVLYCISLELRFDQWHILHLWLYS